MVDAIAKFDVIICAIIALEGCAIFWLVPLGAPPPEIGIWRPRIGASPDGIRKQRLGRFLLPLIVPLVLSILFLPPSTNPVTIAREYVVVALTPLYVVGAVSGVKVMVMASRQRRRVRARRLNHRQRLDMPS